MHYGGKKFNRFSQTCWTTAHGIFAEWIVPHYRRMRKKSKKLSPFNWSFQREALVIRSFCARLYRCSRIWLGLSRRRSIGEHGGEIADDDKRVIYGTGNHVYRGNHIDESDNADEGENKLFHIGFLSAPVWAVRSVFSFVWVPLQERVYYTRKNRQRKGIVFI